MSIQRTTHDVQQGTGTWLRLREDFDTASEAPAALGVGKYTTRAELMRQKHTRIPAEHGSATLGKFAAGHAAEAKARPLAQQVTEGELYPTTMSAVVDGLSLLASLDGQTLLGDIVWETKLWNEALAADVRAGTLDPHYTVQMDQELLVSGAERCLFTCTDGTPERFVSCWYEADPAKFAALLAGWRQFHADLAAYALVPSAGPAPVGKAPDTLPALRIEVTGAVTASNLAEFKRTALGAIRSVNRDLQTDADFADADKAVKWCADVEAKLKAAKEHAQSQATSIDELFKALDDIAAESKAVRLDLAKVIDRRKLEVKEQAVLAARRALDLHIEAANAELAPMRLLPVSVDFAGAIKGLRSITSMQDALDAALAGGKIAADCQARSIRANVAAFKAAADGLEFLFSDLGSAVHKSADDFATMLQARIAAHRLAEAEKARKAAEAEAQRIAAAEQRAREQEAARIAAQQTEDARAAAEAAFKADEPRRLAVAAEHASAALAMLAQDECQPLSAALASKPDAPMHAREAAAAIKASQSTEPATLSLGTICGRLGFTISGAFLADALHIRPTSTDKRAQLYTEGQYQTICQQLQSHVGAMAELYLEAMK